MDWSFKVQLLPRTNTLLGINYQSGAWVDTQSNTEKHFSEVSLGLLIIVFHFEWS